ncbi:MAG: FixH family protein [Pirellulaceae bacterium]|nr:FixH family protein [Pirellulaceae bacterium]
MLDSLPLEFARPTMLVFAVFLIPWLAFGAWRSLVDLPNAQRHLLFGVRLVLGMLLVCAMAGLVWLRTTNQRFVVVAIDQSRSVGEEGQQLIRDWIANAQAAAGDARVVFLPFAATPGNVSEDFLAANDRAGIRPAGWSDLASNLAAAVETARAVIPPNYVPEVVLLSDGNQTVADVHRIASLGEIPISTIPLPDPRDPEVQLSAVDVPTQVREGEPFNLEVVIDSTRQQSAELNLFRDDLKIDTKTVRLQIGENRYLVPQQVAGQRKVVYTVRVGAIEDTFLNNNQASGSVNATGKPRVLLIDSDPATTDVLRWALEEQQIHVDLRPPQGLPQKLDALQTYDAVLLSNVPATEISLRQMQNLRSYVYDFGGGLLVVGGDQAFGLGGYYRTPLEEMLPVRSDSKKDKEKPSLAIVLIIDRSGSMAKDKLELAKDAARGAVELLGPRDQVGVIAFDNSSHWISELHSASDKEFIVNRIRTLATGGGTNMYPALADAYRALQTAVAKLKHVIILTDGISAPGDFAGVTADMVAQRITVSTVAVGDGADEKTLRDIAEIGSGRFYLCDDPQAVPQIFAKETVTASRSAINELPFLPQQARVTRILDGVDLENSPPLLGFVATRAKPTSEIVLTTEEGDPLLAWWRYGLGKTMVFTSDAKSRWASEWMSWPDFPAFWAQLTRSVMRNRDVQQGELNLRQLDDALEVTLDVVDSNGQFQNQLVTQLTLVRPADQVEKETYVVPQTAPGRYSIRIPIKDEGAYFVDLTQTENNQVVLQTSQGFDVGYPAELRLKPTDSDLLRRVSDASGGQFNPTAAEFFQKTMPPASRAEPLWPWLLSFSLFLLVIDIALRRTDLSSWGLGRSKRPVR